MLCLTLNLLRRTLQRLIREKIKTIKNMETSVFIESVEKVAASIVIKDTYKEIKSIVKRSIERTILLTSEKELEDNLVDETKKTSRWAFDDLFKNHMENSDIYSRYIHLDLLLEPRREHINSSQLSRKRPLKDILLANKSNIVILGQPGSGKTTSIKYIVNSILHDSEFLNDVYTLPIVIRLRELNKSNSILNESQNGGIFEKLASIFGLDFNIKHIIKKGNKEKNIASVNTTKEDKNKLYALLKTKIIPYILDNHKILLILDGFDEIIEDNIKELVISEIKELTRSLDYARFILTSRSADFKLLLEDTTVYEISELNSAQIDEFSMKWFEDSVLSKKFLTELYAKTPYEDFYTRPLLLTQLALIYSRTNEIPDKPKMIYQRIVELVLKDWNEQQGLKRKTKYSTFTVERKREFLSSMAFNLTVKYNRHAFTQNDLSKIYREINNKFKELPIDEVGAVIEEIETHNGLILKSGYDNFEFSHLTIQEYFVADYIVRTGNVRRFKYNDLLKIPNELAIAVSLSSEPSIFLYDLLVDIMFKDEIDQDFINKFFNRIKLEKPDFENDVIQVITLLTIYSKTYIKIEKYQKGSFRTSRESSKLSDLEDKKNILEQMIISLFDNSILQALNGFYVEDDKKFNKTNSSLIELKKLKAVETKIGSYNFPKNLYWPRDL